MDLEMFGLGQRFGSVFEKPKLGWLLLLLTIILYDATNVDLTL